MRCNGKRVGIYWLNLRIKHFTEISRSNELCDGGGAVHRVCNFNLT